MCKIKREAENRESKTTHTIKNDRAAEKRKYKLGVWCVRGSKKKLWNN